METFVSELTEEIRAAALEAVQEALSGDTRATPGRKKRGKAKATKKTKAATKKKRVRRTAAQVEATANRILAHVKANPR